MELPLHLLILIFFFLGLLRETDMNKKSTRDKTGKGSTRHEVMAWKREVIWSIKKWEWDSIKEWRRETKQEIRRLFKTRCIERRDPLYIHRKPDQLWVSNKEKCQRLRKRKLRWEKRRKVRPNNNNFYPTKGWPRAWKAWEAEEVGSKEKKIDHHEQEEEKKKKENKIERRRRLKRRFNEISVKLDRNSRPGQS